MSMGLPAGARFGYAGMQAHFNNPQGILGARDSSGFKVTYTTELRPHDIGILALGTNYIVRRERLLEPPRLGFGGPQGCPGSGSGGKRLGLRVCGV
jgi:hypothetical protein